MNHVEAIPLFQRLNECWNISFLGSSAFLDILLLPSFLQNCFFLSTMTSQKPVLSIHPNLLPPTPPRGTCTFVSIESHITSSLSTKIFFGIVFFKSQMLKKVLNIKEWWPFFYFFYFNKSFILLTLNHSWNNLMSIFQYQSRTLSRFQNSRMPIG